MGNGGGIFVRASLDDGSKHEWGWYAKYCVPVIGDTILLNCEIPDEETTGDNCIEAVVVSRQIVPDDDEVWLTLHSDEPVPEGLVADSSAWPSIETALRLKELQEDMRKISGGGEVVVKENGML